MKPINRLFLFLLFISASYAISYAQENQSFFLHTIEKGQSLYSISKMYNVTTSDIIRLNPGCDEKIYAGQTIKIPKGKDTQKGETFHTIQAGETLYKLTTMYNVSALIYSVSCIFIFFHKCCKINVSARNMLLKKHNIIFLTQIL